jgi:hypothetical protein
MLVYPNHVFLWTGESGGIMEADERQGEEGAVCIKEAAG